MNGIKEIMTSKNAKTVLFAGIIAAMILPFSSMNMADAATVQEDTKQKKTDRLEAKLQGIEKKIANVQESISKLKEKRHRAESAGNDDKVQKIDEKIIKHNQKLDKLEAKHAKIKAKLSAKKDQISTTKHLLVKTQQRIDNLKVKIEKAESDGNIDRAEMLGEKLAKSQKRHDQLNDRLDRQYELEDEDAIIIGYSVEDIASSFANAEMHVTFDDSTMHMNVDIPSMQSDATISQKDIDIVLEFADVNDKIMNAFYNQQVQNESRTNTAMETLEAGKFHKLFDPQLDDDTIHQTVDNGNSNVMFAMYNYADTAPILSAFGVDESSIHEVRKTKKKSTNSYFLVCGSYGLAKHHPDNGDHPFYFNTLSGALNQVVTTDKMTKVPSYASGANSKMLDYAKTVKGYGGCNNGEFRDQSVIYKNQKPVRLVENYKEPNPEVFSYPPPDGKIWWRAYVAVWHVAH